MELNFILIYASFIAGFILLWKFYNDINRELWNIRLAYSKLEHEDKEAIKASSSDHAKQGTGHDP